MHITLCLLDRDECKLGHQQGGHNCPLHSTCVNTIGSFECNCEDGFSKVNGQCEGIVKDFLLQFNNISLDINECLLTGGHSCPPHSVCINEEPRYSCNCTSGYEKKGDLCARKFLRHLSIAVL